MFVYVRSQVTKHDRKHYYPLSFIDSMVIIAAVDESERAADVIQQADKLAEAFDETVHIVHVLTPSEARKRGIAAAESLDNSFNIHNEGKKIASKAITELESPYETVGLLGNPAECIVEYADRENGRYIVIAGRKQTPTEKVIFGSVTQSVLLNATIPVISIVE